VTHENNSRWRRFWNLPREDRALVLRAALHLCLTFAGLRLLGFRRCHDLILRISLGRQESGAFDGLASRGQTEKILRAARSVEQNAPFQANCLDRSLALWWMLRLGGIPADLHIGGRKSGKNFEAHAWVECGGQVLNDDADVHKHYARFDAPVAAIEADSR